MSNQRNVKCEQREVHTKSGYLLSDQNILFDFVKADIHTHTHIYIYMHACILILKNIIAGTENSSSNI